MLGAVEMIQALLIQSEKQAMRAGRYNLEEGVTFVHIVLVGLQSDGWRGIGHLFWQQIF